MASQPRQAREADRKLSVQTLAIASISSAAAAVIVSQIWKSGTAPAAAFTPVVVAVVSELLHKPTKAISSRVTTEKAAVLPEGAGAGAPAQRTHAPVTVPATDTEAKKPGSEERPPPLHDDRDAIPSDERATREAPIHYHKASGNGSAPGSLRRRFPVKIVAITAALAFLIGAAILTVPELITGGSVGSRDGGTTIFGGDRSPKTPDDANSQDPQTQDQRDNTSDQSTGQSKDSPDKSKDSQDSKPTPQQKSTPTQTEKQTTTQQQRQAPSGSKQTPAQP